MNETGDKFLKVDTKTMKWVEDAEKMKKWGPIKEHTGVFYQGSLGDTMWDMVPGLSATMAGLTVDEAKSFPNPLFTAHTHPLGTRTVAMQDGAWSTSWIEDANPPDEDDKAFARGTGSPDFLVTPDGVWLTRPRQNEKGVVYDATRIYLGDTKSVLGDEASCR